tara:strand:- start:4782 stop:5207 length:426 start_codon:yes stop_codon:yes gene_type:complete
MARGAIEVTLAVGGNEFSEFVHANSYDAARRVALARNPNAQVVRVTDVFEAEPMIRSQSNNDNVRYSVGTNHSGENSAGGLGGLIILGLLGMGLLGLFGDDETPKTKQYNSSQAPRVEQIYFTSSDIQEEPIDDLGQNWDN